MADIPDFIECGESGSGELADSAEGVQSRDFDLKAILAAPGLVGYDAAEAFAVRKFPEFRRGHKRTNIRVDPIGGGYWVATAHYSNSSLIVRYRGQQWVRFSSWEWETSEKSEKITQAWTDSQANPGVPANANAYVKAYRASDNVFGAEGPTQPGFSGIPDFKGGIGIDADSVNGVQKPFSVFNWNETWIYPASFINVKMPNRLVPDGEGEGKQKTIVGKSLLEVVEDNCYLTNEKEFRGKPPGCILLTGVRSERMNLSKSSVLVTFSFSYCPLRKNFTVGTIVIDEKDGWDYMDIYYETESSGTQLVKRPKFVYISRIFGRMDFEDLGLPTERPEWALPESNPGHVIGPMFEPG
jgi:hypothetical protein